MFTNVNPMNKKLIPGEDENIIKDDIETAKSYNMDFLNIPESLVLSAPDDNDRNSFEVMINNAIEK